MLIAMGIAAALCILIGVFPGPLYRILPFQEVDVEHVTINILDHHIYTTTHVITQLQLLLWSALAFHRVEFDGGLPAGVAIGKPGHRLVLPKANPRDHRLVLSRGGPSSCGVDSIGT